MQGRFPALLTVLAPALIAGVLALQPTPTYAQTGQNDTTRHGADDHEAGGRHAGEPGGMQHGGRPEAQFGRSGPQGGAREAVPGHPGPGGAPAVSHRAPPPPQGHVAAPPSPRGYAGPMSGPHGGGMPAHGAPGHAPMHYVFRGRDVRHFDHVELEHWRGGEWRHEWYHGRYGWWWHVGDVWYFYDQPVYPFPYTVSPIIIEDRPPVVYSPPPAMAPQYWYYCDNPPGYYPYVGTCSVPFRPVVPTGQ